MDVKEKQSSLVSDDIDPDTLCQCGPCKPSWLQIFANPKVFTFNIALLQVARTAMFSYLGGTLTTLERRFQLSSSESGALSILNDISDLCLSIILSYIGHFGHRPRWIAVSAIVTGLGFILSASPHFLTNPLDPDAVISGIIDDTSNVNDTDICYSDKNDLFNASTTLGNEQCDEGSQGGLSGPIKWLILGQILAGLGSAPYYALAISYIDDCVGKSQLTSYTSTLSILNFIQSILNNTISIYNLVVNKNTCFPAVLAVLILKSSFILIAAPIFIIISYRRNIWIPLNCFSNVFLR